MWGERVFDSSTIWKKQTKQSPSTVKIINPMACLHYNFLGSDGFPWFPFLQVGSLSSPLFQANSPLKIPSNKLIAPFLADVPPLKRSAWWDGMEILLRQFLLRSVKYCPPMPCQELSPGQLTIFGLEWSWLVHIFCMKTSSWKIS